MPREKAIKVSSGDVVALAFVLHDRDGDVLVKADPSDPLVLLHGHGFAIAPIDAALEGKEAGDRFELNLEGAFGESVTESEQVVPRDRLPPGPLPAGTAVSVMDDDTVRTAWVLRETGPHVVISFSHPWASASRLEAEIVSVRPATQDEQDAGFATDVSAKAGAVPASSSKASAEKSAEEPVEEPKEPKRAEEAVGAKDEEE